MGILKGVSGEITVKTVAEIQQSLGKTINVRFKTTWKQPTVTEIRAFADAMKNDEVDEEETIRSNLLGWDDLVGAEGEKLEFGEDVLEQMLDHRDYRNALANAYIEVITGKPIEKN
jgi:hypothetical protein